MSGYVEGGYLVTIGVISGYALTLLRRERVVRRRLTMSAGLEQTADDEAASPGASDRR